jgi:hypothetical protein
VFYITDLGRDRLILGYPWFKEFNPKIDWSQRRLVGVPIQIETLSYTKSQETRVQAAEVEDPYQLPNYSGTHLPSYHQAFDPIEGIPDEYQRHAVVFSEKASQRFPPARNEDHAINLKSDAPASIDCKVYPLTPQEQEALKVFLDEEKSKGYIIESNSPYASSFFFIKKKDGKL